MKHKQVKFLVAFLTVMVSLSVKALEYDEYSCGILYVNPNHISYFTLPSGWETDYSTKGNWSTNKSSLLRVSTAVYYYRCSLQVLNQGSWNGNEVYLYYTFLQRPSDANWTRLSWYVALANIKLSETTVTMKANETKQLGATINRPFDATSTNVTWSSNNTSVATVSSTGLITAVSAGTATITCKTGGDSEISATCMVTVTNPNILGDLNSDGEVNGTDLVALTNMILGKSAKTAAADLNGDNQVNGTDYVSLVNIILGKK